MATILVTQCTLCCGRKKGLSAMHWTLRDGQVYADDIYFVAGENCFDRFIKGRSAWYYMSAAQLIGDKIFAFCLLANNGGLLNLHLFFTGNLPLMGFFYDSSILLPSYNVCHIYHFILHYYITHWKSP